VVGICALRGIACVGVSPAEAKLALANHGHADKAAMMRAAAHIFGRSISKDEADACGVALAGQGLLFQQQLLSRY
jgi:Holliday junction resolvasome RuvABC endonuclease subunit